MPGLLLLFDIDGTLLTTGGAGLAALERGFRDAFADRIPRSAIFPALNLSGSTDGQLARELFLHFSLPHTPENLTRFYSAYESHLEAGLKEVTGHGLLPGVNNFLSRIADTEGFTLGLVTGNIQRAAWMKLRRFGLAGYFSTGAFGDDHHDRNELGPIAIRRVREMTGTDFPPERVVVIGDTPRDIACGRAAGTHTVAVATGAHTALQLGAHSPSILIDDFTDHQGLQRRLSRLSRLIPEQPNP